MKAIGSKCLVNIGEVLKFIAKNVILVALSSSQILWMFEELSSFFLAGLRRSIKPKIAVNYIWLRGMFTMWESAWKYLITTLALGVLSIATFLGMSYSHCISIILTYSRDSDPSTRPTPTCENPNLSQNTKSIWWDTDEGCQPYQCPCMQNSRTHEASHFGSIFMHWAERIFMQSMHGVLSSMRTSCRMNQRMQPFWRILKQEDMPEKITWEHNGKSEACRPSGSCSRKSMQLIGRMLEPQHAALRTHLQASIRMYKNHFPFGYAPELDHDSKTWRCVVYTRCDPQTKICSSLIPFTESIMTQASA